MSQLDLFEGIILSQEQQEMIADFKQKQSKATKEKMLSNERLEGALIEAGFLKDVDFKNTFEPTIVTNDVQLGRYSFKGNQFEAKDVTYNTIKGGVCLLSKRYDKEEDKIVDTKINYFHFDGNKNKIECESVVGSYRAVKLTTFLTKLKEQREDAEVQMESARIRKSAFEIAKADLQAEYPNVNIFEFTDFDKWGSGRSYRYEDVKRLKAQFENGSFITFNVSVNGEYRINKKYDAVMATADVETAMNTFINQNK
jgi:hypothetical protein